MEVEKKNKILEEKYQIKMTRELEEAMGDMCNVIEYYERKSRIEALEEGEIKNATANIRSLMDNLDIDIQKAMELLNIEDKYRTIIVNSFKGNKA